MDRFDERLKTLQHQLARKTALDNVQDLFATAEQEHRQMTKKLEEIVLHA